MNAGLKLIFTAFHQRRSLTTPPLMLRHLSLPMSLNDKFPDVRARPLAGDIAELALLVRCTQLLTPGINPGIQNGACGDVLPEALDRGAAFSRQLTAAVLRVKRKSVRCLR